ncbi:hypothetical protein PR048_024924 [Dryococelus australis]|uniref:MADF domain-containing protein n=1 Tax=Dryococelus australis TaxID=614101 RepID=A0ABQ9GPX6_9NEOP|nr:hypothetical protein PR048_024924 [Dryococelus australis]
MQNVSAPVQKKMTTVVIEIGDLQQDQTLPPSVVLQCVSGTNTAHVCFTRPRAVQANKTRRGADRRRKQAHAGASNGARAGPLFFRWSNIRGEMAPVSVGVVGRGGQEGGVGVPGAKQAVPARRRLDSLAGCDTGSGLRGLSSGEGRPPSPSRLRSLQHTHTHKKNYIKRSHGECVRLVASGSCNRRDGHVGIIALRDCRTDVTEPRCRHHCIEEDTQDLGGHHQPYTLKTCLYFRRKNPRTEQLIDEFKKKTSLWDTSSEEYKNRQLNKMQWTEVCTSFYPDFYSLAIKEKASYVLRTTRRQPRSAANCSSTASRQADFFLVSFVRESEFVCALCAACVLFSTVKMDFNTELFIDEIKSKTSLWDTSPEGYKKKDLKVKWRNIRDSCVHYLRAKKERSLSKARKDMKTLPFTGPKKNSRNIDDDVSEDDGDSHPQSVTEEMRLQEQMKVTPAVSISTLEAILDNFQSSKHLWKMETLMTWTFFRSLFPILKAIPLQEKIRCNSERTLCSL